MDDGVFIPFTNRAISDSTKKASINLSDSDKAVLFNGIERPRFENDEGNKIRLNKGDCIEFTYDTPEHIDTLRIQFDLDYKRKSVSPNMKMQWFAQKLHQGLDFVPMKVANTIIRDFEVYADGELVYKDNNNYHSLAKVKIDKDVKKISVKFNDTWGAEKIYIFACDFIEEKL